MLSSLPWFRENDTFVVNFTRSFFFSLCLFRCQRVRCYNFLFSSLIQRYVNNITFISHAKVHDIISIVWNQITWVHFSLTFSSFFSHSFCEPWFSHFLPFCSFPYLDCFERASSLILFHQMVHRVNTRQKIFFVLKSQAYFRRELSLSFSKRLPIIPVLFQMCIFVCVSITVFFLPPKSI